MRGGLETESLNALERGKERKEASPKVAGDLTAHRASHSLRKACCCEGGCNTGREAANTGRDFGLYLGKISFQILLLWDLTPGTKLS